MEYQHEKSNPYHPHTLPSRSVPKRKTKLVKDVSEPMHGHKNKKHESTTLVTVAQLNKI